MAEAIALFAEDDSDRETLRQLEALLFAAPRPLTLGELAARLPEDADVSAALERLQSVYRNRGVVLVSVGEGWAFRTAPDLAPLLEEEREAGRKLSSAALETLAIIAYHQPVTRAEIEEIRGVAVAKGTLDILLETGWVRLRGRRRVPGRPVTFGTTRAFLDHFSLPAISDLPGLDDLKGAGLLEGTPPDGFSVPVPRDDDTLAHDEDPLQDGDDGSGSGPVGTDDVGTGTSDPHHTHPQPPASDPAADVTERSEDAEASTDVHDAPGGEATSQGEGFRGDDPAGDGTDLAIADQTGDDRGDGRDNVSSDDERR